MGRWVQRALLNQAKFRYSTRIDYKDCPQRLVFGSCSDSDEDLTYWSRIASLAPDVVLLMGDNVYGKPPHKPLKSQYKSLLSHPSYQEAMKDEKLTLLAIWDDNDSYRNYDGSEDPAALFKEAFRPRLPSAQAEGIYQAYEWRDELQIILLDLHSHLVDSSHCNSLLGNTQWQWLEMQVQRPSNLRLLVSPQQVLAIGHSYDCWYTRSPEERARLLDILKSHSSGRTLILSGDRHASALYYDDVSNLYEVTSSSLTHSIPKGLLDDEMDPLRTSDFCYENNFGMIDIKEGELVVSICSATTAKAISKWSIPC